MTLAEVEQLTGTRMEVHEFETFGGHCYDARPEGVAAYTFLVIAPRADPPADPRDGVVASVTTGFGAPHTATVAGVAPGDPPETVESADGTARLQRHPHLYQPGGAYLDLVAADGDHGLRFAVGGHGAIEAVHSGDAQAVRAPEGCA